jgi:predicted NAD-dependent protein-ADP-ribosyltransferase YbiA (DUF1768 family)
MILHPLNCSGSSLEEIGRDMSNLAHTPFILDGVKFASVEAFYICLRTPNPEQRLQVAQLHGVKAKHMGSKLKKKFRLTHTTWMDVTFELGSEQHHQLVKRAIRAKLKQNKKIRKEFLKTSPRPITHDTGFPESRFTQLPGEKFSLLLTELRLELSWQCRLRESLRRLVGLLAA